MERLFLWMTRAGALLVAASPMLPQIELTAQRVSARTLLALAPSGAHPLALLLLGLGLHAPLPLGLLVLAGVRSGGTGGGRGLRALTLGALLLFSFAMATLGSLLLTEAGTSTALASPSFPLLILLFLLPLGVGGVALARAVGGDFAAASGGYVRLGLALLLALEGCFLLDEGWGLAVSWAGLTTPVRPLGWAWLLPAGALLAALGELLTRFRPRPAPALPAAT